MASGPAYPSSKERTNFAKLCRAIIDLGTAVLREALFVLIKPVHIRSRIGFVNLDPQQCNNIKNAVIKGNYEDFDISLLYKLLRSLWPSNDPVNYPPPTKGWGGSYLPDPISISYGDDIERLRVLRNSFYGHIPHTEVQDKEFNDSWKILEGVMNRFDSRLKVKRYEKDLNDIKSMCMDGEVETKYIENLAKLAVCDREQFGDIQNRLTDIENQKLTEKHLQIKDGLQLVKEEHVQLKDGFEEVKEGHVQLQVGLQQVTDGHTQLQDGLQQVIEVNAKLKDGLQEVKVEHVQQKYELQEFSEQHLQLKKDVHSHFETCSTGHQTLMNHVKDVKKFSQNIKLRHETLSQRFESIENEYIFREVEKKKERIGNTEIKISNVVAENCNKFVKTRAFDQLLQNMKRHRCALIKGNPGDGKTTLAIHCMQTMLSHSDQTGTKLHPIQIRDPVEWNSFIGGNMIIFIDDIFGLYSPSENEPLKWKGVLEDMKSSTDNLKENRNYLLVTAKNEVYHKIPSPIKDLFPENIVIDLNSDWRLSEEEIKCMIKAYTPENFIFEKKELRDIIDNKIPFGLPQTCSLFHHFHDRRADFFKHPIEYLKKDIDTRSKVAKSTYAVLVFFFLMGRPVRSGELSDLCTEQTIQLKIQQVSDLCQLNLSGERTGTAYQKTAKSLIGVFLRYDKSTQCYDFLHNSIQDVVGLQLYDDYQKECIEYSSVHLFERIRSNSDSTSETINSISIRTANFSDLAKKVLFFLERNDVEYSRIIARSKIWEDDKFNETFKTMFNEAPVPSSEKQPQTSFIYVAADAGNLNLVKTLMSLNVFGSEDYTAALNAASSNGHECIALFLLDMKVSPTSETIFESIRGNCLTLFERLLRQMQMTIEKTRTNISIFHKFMQLINRHKTVSIDTRGTSESKRFKIGETTILHEACELGRTELVTIILQRFPDLISWKDDIGCNAIHSAAFSGNVDILKLLVESKNGYQYGNECNLYGCTILHQVCCSGNIDSIDYLTNKYPNLIHKKDNNNEGILHWAALHGTYEVFEYIMKRHKETLLTSDINNKSNNGATILHFACQSGNIRLVKCLAECFPVMVNEVDINGYTVLHYACKGNGWDIGKHIKYGRDEETVQYLIDIGMDVNQLTSEGQSIFHVACQNQNEELFKFVYSKYSETWSAKTDGHQWNLLHCCAHSRNLEFIRYLQEIGIDIKEKTNRGETLLHLASFCGNVKLCDYLPTEYKDMLDVNTLNGSSALHYASEGGFVEIFKLLISNEEDIMQTNAREETVLHLACLKGHLLLCKYLINYNNKLLNCTNIDGFSVLHYACQGESIELVEFLIQNNVDAYETTNLNETVLHVALLASKEDICKFLVTRYPGLITIKSENDWNVLHYASEGGSVTCLNLLCTNKLDILETTEDNESVLHLAALTGNTQLCKHLLDKTPELLTIQTKNKLTVLHCACQGGDITFIDYLITERETNVLATTTQSQTCLHIASYHGHAAVSKYILEHLCNRNLLYHKDDKDVHGWSALHYACQGGDIETVKLLMNYGLQLEEKTKTGASGLHTACLSGNLQLFKIISKLCHDILYLNDNDDWNILHYAAKSGSVSLVSYLSEVIKEANTAISILDVTREGETILHIACEYGHLDLCQYLINSFYGQLVTKKTTNGSTVLHYIAKGGNVQLIKVLLKRVSANDIYNVTDFGQSILHVSALHNNVEMCNFLIEKYPDLLQLEDDYRWTFLYYCIYEGDNNILDFAAKIKSKELNKKNVLTLSCLVGDITMCRFLLEKHSKLLFELPTNEWTLHHGDSANRGIDSETLIVEKSVGVFQRSASEEVVLRILHAKYKEDILCFLQRDNLHKLSRDKERGIVFFPFTSTSGDKEIACIYILHLSKISEIPELPIKILQSACLQNKYKICTYFLERYPKLLSYTDSNNTNILMFACAGNSLDIVEFLIQKGVDVHHKNEFGETCLHVAVSFNCIDVVKYLTKKHPSLKKIKSNIYGFNALQLAAHIGNKLDMFTTLISSREDVYEPDGIGRTVLQIVCLNNQKDICNYIMLRYPDMINILYKDLSVLHFACIGGDVELLRILLNNKNVDPYIKNKDGSIFYRTFTYPFLLGNTECDDPFTKIPTKIRCITKEGKKEVIEYLINRYPDLPGMRNDDGRTALHMAAATDLDFLKIFLKREMDAFDTDNSGWNILHIAVSEGKKDVVLHLLHHYPELVKIKTKENKTSIHIAREENQTDILQMLVSYCFSKQIKYLSTIYPLVGFKQSVSAFEKELAERDITLFEYSTVIDPDLSKTDAFGRCVLHLAVINDDEEMCTCITQSIRYRNVLMSAKDSNGYNAIQIAAGIGCKVELFKTIISVDVGIYETDKKGRTILHLACLGNHRDIINYILEKYSDLVNVSDKDNWSVLHYASHFGYVSLLKKLYNFYVDLTPYLTNANGDTILHVACIYPELSEVKLCFDSTVKNTISEVDKRKSKKEVIEHLINKFPYLLDIQNNHGRTALHMAAAIDLDFLKIFLKREIDAFDTDSNGWNILHIAVSEGKTGIVLHLLHHYPELVKIKTKENKTPIHIAREENQTDILQMLVSYCFSKQIQYLSTIYPLVGFKQSVSAFEKVLAERDITLFECLTEIDPDLSKTDATGRCVLHLAVINDDEEMCKCITQSIRYKNVLMGAKDSNGYNAIQIAARIGCRVDLFKTIISVDVGVYETDNKGRTILHLACLGNHRDIINYILEKYPDLINVSDKDNWSVLHYASQCGDVSLLNFFFKRFCVDLNPNVTNANGDTILHVSCTYPELSEVKLCSSVKNSVSKVEKRKTKKEVIEHLINKFPYLLDIQNNHGRTALHHAAESELDFVKIFLNQKLDIYETDNDGWTVLHIAVYNGRREIAQHLMHHDPKLLECKTKENKTAVQYARERNQREILKMLVDQYYDKQIQYLSSIYRDYFILTFEQGLYGIYTQQRESNFHKAIAERDITLFQFLMEKDPNHEKTDVIGRNILHYAVFNEDEEMCRCIMQHLPYKRLLDMKDIGGNTPLDVAIRKNQMFILKILLRANDELYKNTGSEKYILHLAVLRENEKVCSFAVKKYPESLIEKDSEGRTVLHIASEIGSLEIFKLLLKHHANVFEVTNENKTILHLAAERGSISICKHIIFNSPSLLYSEDSERKSPRAYAVGNRNLWLILFTGQSIFLIGIAIISFILLRLMVLLNAML